MYYFAYGSNMDLNRLSGRIKRKPEGIAGYLEDYTLVFNKVASKPANAGYANIIESSGKRVHGVIFDLTESEFKILDKCEGVASGDYYRKTMSIHTDSKIIEAIVYIACLSRVKENLMPTREYLNYLLAGQCYLPDEYFKNLSRQITIG